MNWGKEKLDLQREYEMLSPTGKKVWDRIAENFDEVADEMDLSKKEKEAMLQRYMAELVYNDLAATNEYLNRTNEAFSQRRINKNKLEMQKMSRVYHDHESEVKGIEQEFAQKMKEKTQEKENEQKR